MRYEVKRYGESICILNEEEILNFCKQRKIVKDNLVRTLDDYPNVARRSKQYLGYKLYKIDSLDINNEVSNVNNDKDKFADKKEIDFNKGQIKAEKIINLDTKNIKEEDILKEFNLDIKEWSLEKLNYSVWDGRDKENGTIPLYSVKCTFKKKTNLDFDINTMKSLIDSCLSVDLPRIESKQLESYDNTLLINIADLHLNKLSVNYNSDIAISRFKNSLNYFLEKSNSKNVIFVVGEDFFNIDTKNRTTTKGTPQDTENNIYEMFEKGLKLMITTITHLSEYFEDVKVILVQGNHDTVLSYMLSVALYMKFQEYDNVFIDYSISKRKYLKIGNTLLGLGHLDTENKTQKQFLMQNEAKKEYGESKYNYFVSGHLHNYSVEEIGGITYIRLPSLSGVDEWHNDMGYVNSNKGAIALEFDKERGLVNQIHYNVGVGL